ncbi:MAG: hypothetical protein IPK10_03275 [Bacteroidetes bacterium]|nr:hypothetical protein [Bacteroidota bacterium]
MYLLNNEKTKALLFLILLSASISYSQVGNEIDSDSASISEVFLVFGGATGVSTVENLRDFRRMAPSSLLLKEDLSDYSSYPSNEWFSHQYFGVMVGFIPGKKNRKAKKYSPLIRVGLSYENADYFDNYYSKSTSLRFDTLYNSQGQSIYYRDSVNYKSTSMYYSSSSLSTEASILLRTSAAKRWMFYIGAGFSGGVSFKNEVTVSKTETEFVDEYEISGLTSNINTSHNNLHELQNEIIDVGSSWVLSGFVPLGIDFRLGKKNEFLKQVHLFAEFRPGIKMMDIPTVGMNTSTFTLSSFGLRYVWN